MVQQGLKGGLGIEGGSGIADAVNSLDEGICLNRFGVQGCCGKCKTREVTFFRMSGVT